MGQRRSFLPMRSASGGTARQPRMVPSDSRPMPNEDIFTAWACTMPARLAKPEMAVGAYTAPAHSPQIAEASSTC